MPRRPNRKRIRAHDNPTFGQLVIAANISTDVEETVACVSQMLGIIPDLTKSRGFKQLHASFDLIAPALDEVLARTQDQREREISGAPAMCDQLASVVISIFGRMGDDSFLRTRIFEETKFLETAIAVLRSGYAGAKEVVMNTLSEVTHFHDNAVLRKIARHTSTILDAAETHLDNLDYAETAVCVLTHATASVVDAEDPELDFDVDLERVLRFALDVVRLPGSTHVSFIHLVIFAYDHAAVQADVFFSIPDSVDFLIACTRAHDIRTRISAQRCLVLLCADLAKPPAESDHSDDSEDEPPKKPAPRVSARARMTLDKYYRNSESWTSTANDAYDQLDDLVKTDETRSPLEIGRAIADLAVRRETLLRKYTDLDGGETFLDLLQECEIAVRAEGDETNADVLHVQFLVSDGQWEEALTFARTCLERYPSVGYFYYIMALAGDLGTQTILFADKGLQCPGISEYLRLRLLSHSTYASMSVLAEMAQGLTDEIRLRELNLLLQQAYGNAREFLRIAPPEDPQVPFLHALEVHLQFCTQAARRKFFFARDVARYTETGFHAAKECLALEKILTRMPHAWRVWGPTVSQYPSDDYPTDSNTTSPGDPNDELLAWLEKLDTSPADRLVLEIRGAGTVDKRYGPAQLPLCAACNTASAVLKKCGGCQKTRYCDDACQKRHWKVHREVCKASRAAES